MDQEYPRIEVDPKSVHKVFLTASENEEIIRIELNGDIYVRGKLSTDDKEIVKALREAVRNQNK